MRTISKQIYTSKNPLKKIIICAYFLLLLYSAAGCKNTII